MGADLRVAARSGGASDCPPVRPCSVRWDLSSAEGEREEGGQGDGRQCGGPRGGRVSSGTQQPAVTVEDAEASATGRGGVLARPPRRDNQTLGADSAASPRQREGGRGGEVGGIRAEKREGFVGRRASRCYCSLNFR